MCDRHHYTISSVYLFTICVVNFIGQQNAQKSGFKLTSRRMHAVGLFLLWSSVTPGLIWLVALVHLDLVTHTFVFLLWHLWDSLRGLSSGSETLLWTSFHGLKGQRSDLNKLKRTAFVKQRILPTQPPIVIPISLFGGFSFSCCLFSSYWSCNLDRLVTCDFFVLSNQALQSRAVI